MNLMAVHCMNGLCLITAHANLRKFQFFSFQNSLLDEASEAGQIFLVVAMRCSGREIISAVLSLPSESWTLVPMFTAEELPLGLKMKIAPPSPFSSISLDARIDNLSASMRGLSLHARSCGRILDLAQSAMVFAASLL
mmetsp:Transcript_9052/g.23720  ORF Transcript_9052/g.23720 Transcript_9052/m.23720 type:complete len:138 (+) Transcript_9052:279-692(+)